MGLAIRRLMTLGKSLYDTVNSMSLFPGQLEEELKARIEKWEQEQSMAFVVNGQKFMEYVTEQWELHRLEKERAKQERVSCAHRLEKEDST